MPRRTPPDRLQKLIAVAAQAFVDGGFRLTQMDDVAARLGVSKGTVYRSVDSKESLLAAVLLYGDTPEALPTGGVLPPIALGELSSIIREQITGATAGLALAEVAHDGSADHLTDLGDEVERVALDQFAVMEDHRVRVMVLDRCAADIPEIAGDWYHTGRYFVEDLWRSWFDRRATEVGAATGHAMLARTINEVITIWAVKMPWDPAPRIYADDPAGACAALVRNLVTGAAR